MQQKQTTYMLRGGLTEVDKGLMNPLSCTGICESSSLYWAHCPKIKRRLNTDQKKWNEPHWQLQNKATQNNWDDPKILVSHRVVERERRQLLLINIDEKNHCLHSWFLLCHGPRASCCNFWVCCRSLLNVPYCLFFLRLLRIHVHKPSFFFFSIILLAVT